MHYRLTVLLVRIGGADGVLRDWRDKPVDWQPGQPRAGIWDMGHKPGHKYSDVWRSYVNGEMTPQQFLDWYNDPKNYESSFHRETGLISMNSGWNR